MLMLSPLTLFIADTRLRRYAATCCCHAMLWRAGHGAALCYAAAAAAFDADIFAALLLLHNSFAAAADAVFRCFRWHAPPLRCSVTLLMICHAIGRRR